MTRATLSLVLLGALLIGAWSLGYSPRESHTSQPAVIEREEAPAAEPTVLDPPELTRSEVPGDSAASNGTTADALAPKPDSNADSKTGLRVRVVDPQGRALAGVGVLLRGEVEGAKNSQKTYAESATGADGWAVLVEDAENVERRERMRSILGTAFLFDVCADVLFDPAPTHSLGSTPQSAEPIVLTVPASGAFRVHVLSPDGGPLPEYCQVFVHWRPSESAEGFQRIGTPRATVVDGVADFPVLPLGQEFRFGASGGKRYRYGEVIAPGPIRAGERREVQLVLGPPMAVLTGRLVGEDGEPLKSRSVSMALFTLPAGAPAEAEPERIPWLWVKLDEDGRFRKATPLEPGPEERIVLMVHEVARHTPSEVDRFARWDEARTNPIRLDLSPGAQNDLGDIVLRPHHERRFLVSGRVTAEDGGPLKNVRVSASFYDAEDRRWHSLAEERIEIEEDGTFEVHTIEADPPESFTVSASARGFSGESVDAYLGQRGIELILRRAGGLSGRFVTDDPRALPLLAVELKSGDFSRSPDCALGSFHVDGLVPGTYAIYAKAHGTDWIFGGVEDIEVPKGEFSSDPRLESIDLGSACRVLKLRVQTADGRPIPKHYVDIDDDARQGGNFRTDDDGELVALVPESAEVLQVSVFFDGERLGSWWHAASGYEATLTLTAR